MGSWPRPTPPSRVQRGMRQPRRLPWPGRAPRPWKDSWAGEVWERWMLEMLGPVMEAEKWREGVVLVEFVVVLKVRDQVQEGQGAVESAKAPVRVMVLVSEELSLVSEEVGSTTTEVMVGLWHLAERALVISKLPDESEMLARLVEAEMKGWVWGAIFL